MMTGRRRSTAAVTAAFHLLLLGSTIVCHGFFFPALSSPAFMHDESRSSSRRRSTFVVGTTNTFAGHSSPILAAARGGMLPQDGEEETGSRRTTRPQRGGEGRTTSRASIDPRRRSAAQPTYQVIEREDEYEIIAATTETLRQSEAGRRRPTPRDNASHDDYEQQERASSDYRIVALRRGSVVKIVVGENNRKAWKKRRRSSSPLLVGCTIVSMDPLAAVRSNVLALLRSHSRVNLNLLLSRYRTKFGEPISPAAVFGADHDDTDDTNVSMERLFQQLFKNPKYKVNVVKKNDIWYLESYKYRQQSDSSVTPTLEFTDDWRHTGTLAGGTPVSAALRVTGNGSSDEDDSNNGLPEAGTEVYAVVWDFEPEGDAGFPLLTLSLNPPPETSSRNNPTSNNSSNKAITDGGTEKALSIGQPLRGVVRKTARKGVVVECMLGSGTNKNKRLPSQEAATMRGVLLYRDARFPAAVEGEVGQGDDQQTRYKLKPQKRNSKYDDDEEDDDEDDNGKEGTIEDLFRMEDDDDEDDEDYDDEDDDDGEINDLFRLRENESEEDITDLFTQNEDGSMTFTNPETGLVETIPAMRELDDDDDDVDLPSNDYKPIDDANFNYSLKKATATANNGSTADTSDKKKTASPTMPRYNYVRVNVGDQVDVFVKSFSPGDRRLFLTMDPTIKSQPKKQRRQLDNVNKRTERLIQRLGGMKAIRSLRGTECDGVVKATSNMGDRSRLYIQPMNNDDDDDKTRNLPVGVATCPDPDLMDLLQQGDSVRVRLEGLDEQRGQLAMVVLERMDRRSPPLPQQQQQRSRQP
jgi:hypothetical protein